MAPQPEWQTIKNLAINGVPKKACELLVDFMQTWGFAMIEFMRDGSIRVHNHIPVYKVNTCPSECFSMTLEKAEV